MTTHFSSILSPLSTQPTYPFSFFRKNRIIKKKEIRDREKWMKQFEKYVKDRGLLLPTEWSATISVEPYPDTTYLPPMYILGTDLDTILGTSNNG